jgi:hypothetical protein
MNTTATALAFFALTVLAPLVINDVKAYNTLHGEYSRHPSGSSLKQLVTPTSEQQPPSAQADWQAVGSISTLKVEQDLSILPFGTFGEGTASPGGGSSSLSQRPYCKHVKKLLSRQLASGSQQHAAGSHTSSQSSCCLAVATTPGTHNCLRMSN